MSASVHEKMIGLTGGMGSGKSAVAVLLKELCGAEYIDSDTVCRKLLLPHENGWRAVKEVFDRPFVEQVEVRSRQVGQIVIDTDFHNNFYLSCQNIKMAV